MLELYVIILLCFLGTAALAVVYARLRKTERLEHEAIQELKVALLTLADAFYCGRDCDACELTHTNVKGKCAMVRAKELAR